MLSVTFQPLTTFTDDLLSAIADFLQPVIIQFAPGQLGSVAALQLELALVPLRIIAGATMGIQGYTQTPVETPQSPIVQKTEGYNLIATIDWLKLEDPATDTDTETMPNIIDMAKARQQRELPTEPQEMPTEPQEVPTDAFTVMGADGRFAVSEYPDGHLVRRWVQLKKGPHFSQHRIPTGGLCDCRQSALGVVCCHHKALKSHIEKQHIEGKVIAWRAEERAQRLEAFRYQVMVWSEGAISEPRVFWEGSNLDDAEFKLTVASQQPTTGTAKIYDRMQDENLKFWHRPTQAQIEDARQALGLSSTPKPTGDWQSRQELEDSIVEAASKLGWLPAQCTTFQRSTLGLPIDSQLTRSDMTAEQLQQVAAAFTAALKEKQSEKRRQAALKGRVA